MPIPKPSSTEKKDKKGQQKFISRCMESLKDEFPNQKQRLAVCFDSYRKSKKKKKAKGSLEEPTWEEWQKENDKNGFLII